MTATLPAELRAVFERFITTEYTTIDARGQPITWPRDALLPRRGGAASTSRPASATRRRPTTPRATRSVALLFSEPHRQRPGRRRRWCSSRAPRASTSDDLDANRERYGARRKAKLPGAPKDAAAGLPRALRELVLRPHLRPRPARARLRLARRRHRARARAVRRPHRGGALGPRRGARRAARRAGGRRRGLGRAHGRARRDATDRGARRSSRPTASRSPCRVPVALDRGARRVRIEGEPLGVPVAARAWPA